MKKLLKIILVLAVLAVILLIAAVITLRIMFPPEKLKAMAQQYAHAGRFCRIRTDDV